MKHETKVSVTMPAYNAERFIAASIESVLRQDYPNFELVILDDGSTDKTYSIIKRYAKDPTVRIYRQKNRGLGSARNRLGKLARGKYISPHDSDDIMLSGKLKTQAEYLNRHPDVGLVYGKALFTSANGKRIKAFKMESTVGKYFGKDMSAVWDLLYSFIPFGSCMYRKNILKKAGGHNTTLKCATDIDIFLKLAEVTKFHFIDRPFYMYRRHAKNLSKDRAGMNNEIIHVKKKAILRRYGKNEKLSLNW